MTFFEQELRKIMGPQYPDATYMGQACYIRLDDMNRAKLQFTTCGMADHYEALQMTILNRSGGIMDKLILRFEDLWGKKQVSNPNFRNGVSPHIWDDYGKCEWYIYRPSASDYQQLTDTVCEYLDLFQEQSLATGPQWEQSM